MIDKEIGRVNSLNISIREKDKLINELKSIPLYRKGYGLSIGCLTNQLMAIFLFKMILIILLKKNLMVVGILDIWMTCI
ncbi:MAG: hypothetical protein L6V91_03645 [Bacilli bacterium]|nr:MAG: hypothetical protein L6V91_03645 [Bacilli bacterium]